MTAQDLKNSILQLAVQGKLVEQRPEEGTAKELLEQIREEKERLIKEKKIKKSKPLPEITEDEIPFEIPESWEWVRIENICSMISDGTHKTPTYVDGGIPFVSVKDISNGYLDLSNVKYITLEEHHKLVSRCKPELNDVLICRIGTLGKAIRINTRKEFSIFVSLGLIKLIEQSLADYIVLVINSGYGFWWIDKNKVGGGTHTYKINLDSLRKMPVPIPPLKEQQRIIEKSNGILPYIDQYDKAYTKLEAFNKKFPEDMKKSILQLAMQGKLVEQRPEEGTAEELYEQIREEKQKLIKEGKIKKEKPLPEITKDEIPFEIPKNWKWVRLNSLCEKIGSGSTPPGGKSVYKDTGIKFLRSQNIYNDGLKYDGIVYISEEMNKPGSIVKAKDVLLNITGGSIGRCAVVPDDFDVANINQHVMIIRNVDLDLRFWVHFVITSPYIQKKIMDVQVGVSREGLSAEKLKHFLIPLPPLAEQHRIVARIEELLPYCDQLIK